MEIIRIGSRSTPRLAAGAIASVIRANKKARVQAIGASAVNQAVKSVIIARAYLERDKINAVCIPGFVAIELDGEEKTGVEFQISVVNKDFDIVFDADFDEDEEFGEEPE